MSPYLLQILMCHVGENVHVNLLLLKNFDQIFQIQAETRPVKIVSLTLWELPKISYGNYVRGFLDNHAHAHTHTHTRGAGRNTQQSLI